MRLNRTRRNRASRRKQSAHSNGVVRSHGRLAVKFNAVALARYQRGLARWLASPPVMSLAVEMPDWCQDIIYGGMPYRRRPEPREPNPVPVSTLEIFQLVV